MHKLFAYAAGASWVALALVTMIGALTRHSGLIGVNCVMAAIFGAVGAFVIWRMQTVDRLLKVTPDGPEARAVRRSGTISSFVMFCLGATCLTGAVSRVWIEELAVFG